MNKFISRNFLLPLADLMTGQTLSKHLDFLEKSQWWSGDALLEYQNEKLRMLVRHAYNNVPYYTELFHRLGLRPEDVSSAVDLAKLPILTKEEIRANLANGKIIARNLPRRQMILNASSGSTGEPLQYYGTKGSYSFSLATNLRGWYWMGYRFGDRYLKLSQNPRGRKKKVQDLLNNCIYLFSQRLVDDQFQHITRRMIETAPNFIRGYPDVLFFWAQFIKSRNIPLPQVLAVTTTGNVLLPHMRTAIEETFSAPVFDAYACEGGANVFECSTHECYHSSMEYAISEVVALGGEAASQPDYGTLVTTDLHNLAVPFIRYNTQDVIRLSATACSCGRCLLPIRAIEGRKSDILITPAGQYLIVHNFTGYFEWVNAVEKFQIHQTECDELVFHLKVNKNYNQSTEDEIIRYWSKYTNDLMKIRISIVEEIPLTASGKRRFLIRHAHIPL